MRGKPQLKGILAAAIMAAAFAGHSASAQAPNVEPDGTIHVPAFDLPISPGVSPEARQWLIDTLRNPPNMYSSTSGYTSEAAFRDYVIQYRKTLDGKIAKPASEKVMAAYGPSLSLKARKIAGVRVEDFTPHVVAEENKNRVLINLHGGGFIGGAVYLGRVESAPIASLGKIRVVSVDYRQGYEYKFPAANEDVAAVFAELAKQYPARNIGIYGCSAGGALTAEVAAWMIDKNLPLPGAIGIFGSGAGGAGDSSYFAPIATGAKPPPPPPAGAAAGARPPAFGYFSAVTADQARLVNPLLAPAALAKFPPTLLISGTRAFDMSPAILTHRALTRAGADASLQIFEGMMHCFLYFNDLPESRDAYDTITRFFDRHLGK